MSISTTAATLDYSVGYTCPVGPEFAGTFAYGKKGFDWVGDLLWEDHEVGQMQACCQDGGGDGIFGPGVFYSLCDPDNGCKGDKYTCSVYENVTGTKPAPGRISGLAQAPMATQLKPAKTNAAAVSFANPWTGACKAASNATVGYDEFNATMLATYSLHFPAPGTNPNYEFYNISGAICAPQCDPQGQCSTTNLPTGTTASPRCALFHNNPGSVFGVSGCALMCDPTDPSGTGGATSKCPAGATCQQQYPEYRPKERGIFQTGVCTYAK